MITDTQSASDDEHKEIEIKNILVPIDGSEYSLHAAQYATRIARNEKAQLFCIHVVTPRIPYGYATPATSPTKNQGTVDAATGLLYPALAGMARSVSVTMSSLTLKRWSPSNRKQQ